MGGTTSYLIAALAALCAASFVFGYWPDSKRENEP